MSNSGSRFAVPTQAKINRLSGIKSKKKLNRWEILKRRLKRRKKSKR